MYCGHCHSVLFAPAALITLRTTREVILCVVFAIVRWECEQVVMVLF